MEYLHILSINNSHHIAYRYKYNNIHIPNTVGTYSPGKELEVYEISMHVFPTLPSPTTMTLISCPMMPSCLKDGGYQAIKYQGGGLLHGHHSAEPAPNLRPSRNLFAGSVELERKVCRPIWPAKTPLDFLEFHR